MFPVGLILKGASLAKGVIDSIKGGGKVAVPDGAATVQGVKLSPSEIAATPSKDAANQTMQDSIALAKAAQPQAGGLPALISRIGGVAKSLMSCLNDDEWFSKYTGNGAAFNELLKNTKEADNQAFADAKGHTTVDAYNILTPYAEVDVAFNSADEVMKTFMPSVLAYVRTKTNNVLTSETSAYTEAVIAAINTLMLYYHLEKVTKAALNVPANVPSLTEVIPFSQPINITAIVGIRDALKDYIDSTIRLPYAITSYIRWRFGTLFNSANTKKAGIISYCPLIFVDGVGYGTNSQYFTSYGTNDSAIMVLQDCVSKLKQKIATVGRANADLYVAYSDHEIKFNVDDAHYDEKEFCLRQNFVTKYTNRGQDIDYAKNAYDLFSDNVLVMDSRLDMNAAIQAILISTATNSQDDLVPFPVYDEHIYFDNSACSAINVFEALANSALTVVRNLHSKCQQSPENWYVLNLSDLLTAHGDGETAGLQAGIICPISGTKALLNSVSPEAEDKARQKALGTMLYNLGASALEMHLNRSVRYYLEDTTIGGSAVNRMLFLSAPLAFDYARLTDASVQSIQRAALLNLFRGEYKRKSTTNVTDAAKEVIKDVTKGKVEIEEKN